MPSDEVGWYGKDIPRRVSRRMVKITLESKSQAVKYDINYTIKVNQRFRLTIRLNLNKEAFEGSFFTIEPSSSKIEAEPPIGSSY